MPKRDLETESGDIDSDSLCTPPLIRDRLYELWNGPPGCDPCSNPHSIIRARRELHEFGIALPWYDEREKPSDCYQNHPYSINEPWSIKATYEMRVGNVRELVVLCMTATSTAWWSTFMNYKGVNPRVICTKRLKFLGPNGKPLKSGARFDTSLIFYPSRKSRIAKFDKLFNVPEIARWSTWGR